MFSGPRPLGFGIYESAKHETNETSRHHVQNSNFSLEIIQGRQVMIFYMTWKIRKKTNI